MAKEISNSEFNLNSCLLIPDEGFGSYSFFRIWIFIQENYATGADGRQNKSALCQVGNKNYKKGLQDNILGEDDDKENELEVIDGVGAETGQCRKTTVGGRNS
ncbi:hypothetical protein C5167_018877 [Papaver somniferum]|uniref:Uncharacterized protein n=1 Tax=Papaver somniferum TaxID=3469 RepID=A0A4Y7INJ7_PAPSO|nr:hypothetical protein C5167_018877 [Papaver somniferum]